MLEAHRVASKEELDIESLRMVLSAQENLYVRAKERVMGVDQEWNEEYKAGIEEIFRLVLSVSSDDPATKATFTLGKLNSIVRKLRAPQNIVDKYEIDRKNLDMRLAIREDRQAAVEGARSSFANQHWRKR